MTAPDLKPCPFCGGKPYLANVAMAGCAYVVCTDCRLQTDDGSQERVTAAWNTRTTHLAEALAVPEQQAFMNALAFGNIHAEGGCQCDLCRASRDLVAALRAIEK